jgi:hypothetical protein
LASLGEIEMTKHRLTHILHGKASLNFLSFKFSNNQIAPELGTYSEDPPTTTNMPNDKFGSDLVSMNFNIGQNKDY